LVKFGQTPEYIVEHRRHGIKILTGVLYADLHTVRLGAMTAGLCEYSTIVLLRWRRSAGARRSAFRCENLSRIRTIATRNDDGRDATSRPSGGGVAAADPSLGLPTPVHAAGPIALRSQGWAACLPRQDQVRSASLAPAR
jgi:hypothetical protein